MDTLIANTMIARKLDSDGKQYLEDLGSGDPSRRAEAIQFFNSLKAYAAPVTHPVLDWFIAANAAPTPEEIAEADLQLAKICAVVLFTALYNRVLRDGRSVGYVLMWVAQYNDSSFLKPVADELFHGIMQVWFKQDEARRDVWYFTLLEEVVAIYKEIR